MQSHDGTRGDPPHGSFPDAPSIRRLSDRLANAKRFGQIPSPFGSFYICSICHGIVSNRSVVGSHVARCLRSLQSTLFLCERDEYIVRCSSFFSHRRWKGLNRHRSRKDTLEGSKMTEKGHFLRASGNKLPVFLNKLYETIALSSS